MTLPNFFIVGAPKCGTTALYAYLAQHPDVFMSDPKEPHYFGSDLDFRYRRRPSDQQYRSYFAGAGDRRRIGEGSVWYLYSECAADEIGQAVPDARIIVMLRDPVEMIPSLHSQFVYNGHEDLALADALAAEQDRAEGRRIPSHANFPRGLLYRRVATYAPQLARYLDRFGRERVHVILYDDFRADTAGAYRDTLAFLGVDPDHQPDFAVVNASKRSRNMVLRRALNDPPEWLRKAARRVAPQRMRRRLYRSAVNLNTEAAARDALTGEAAERLRGEMEGANRELEVLLGRELPAWIPAEGSAQ
ncbi:MAG TPA: sulfotransferase [Candidatus Limnocylindria bacterium]